MAKLHKFLFIGDVVGDPGIEACNFFIKELKSQHNFDLVIANGENSAKDGRGLTEKSVQALTDAGVDFFTTGNHVWRHDNFYTQLNNSTKIVRPANFPTGVPGKGYSIITTSTGLRVAIINVMGRVFFKENLSCPFKEVDGLVQFLKAQSDLIFVDFHAEATSEKAALAYYMDGKITALWGTHTHVQTADNRILPKGTAFITDLGFCGALNSCLGVERYTVINHFLSQMPARFKVETNRPLVFSAAILTVEKTNENEFKNMDFSRVYSLL